MPESGREELNLTCVDEVDDWVLKKCGKHKRRNWNWKRVSKIITTINGAPDQGSGVTLSYLDTLL